MRFKQLSDCVLGDCANLVIVKVDPIPYYSVHVYICESTNCNLGNYNNRYTLSQFNNSTYTELEHVQ